MRRTSKGFTLIELMIVLAVVAIIAAIAIPSYTSQVRKSRRADATRFLGDLQLQLEKWRAENPCYGRTGAGGCPTFTESGSYPTMPGSASPYYTIAIASATPTTFSLTATPTGAQTGDTCGVLTLAYDPSSSTPATRIGKPQWATASCN